MPDHARRRCKVCNRHDSEVGPISWGGYCGECGPMLERAHNDSVRAGEGLGHERRRYGIIRRELGPRVALALKQAGVFGPLDESQEGV